MALGDGGLDAQVEQRMDTYRNNPAQLQKRYGQSKELLDLLALQKLTKNMKEVAAAMQLEQSQQPGTIAEQREAEALELVKQEQAGGLADLQSRTKDTLDQKHKMQGKGMQKIAQGAGRPPQQAGGLAGLTGGQPARPPMPPQGGPQAAGLANARMMQAANGGPVRRMAGGGIVGFASGSADPIGSNTGPIYNSEDPNLLPPAPRAGGKYTKPRTLTLEEKTALQNEFGGNADRYIRLIESGNLAGITSGQGTRDRIAALGITPDTYPDPSSGLDPLSLASKKPPLPMNTGPQFDPEDPNLLPPEPTMDTGGSLDPNDPNLLPPPLPDVREDTGGSLDPNDPNLLPQKVEPPASALPDAIQTIDQIDATPMDSVNDMSGDVALRKGTAFSDDYLNRDANNQSFEDMKTRMSEFDKENYSPNEDLNNFLIGMGGTGSMGEAMKGGKAAMDKSKTNRRNRMVDEFLMEESRMDMDAGLGKAGLILGTSMSKDAQLNERNMITVFNSMTMKQMDIAAKDADRIAQQQADLLVSADKKLTRQINLLQVKNQSIEIKQKAATQVLTEINITRDALRLAEETTGPESEALRNAGDELADAIEDGAPRRIAGAQAEVAAIRARIYAAVENVLNQPNDAGQNRLELETLANQVFQDTLSMPTLSGNISGFRE